MCDHAPNREAAMVVISNGVWCDPCLQPLVRALNEGGLPTVASCCGHGRRPGRVALADGRQLLVLPDLETELALGGLWPGINHESGVCEEPASMTLVAKNPFEALATIGRFTDAALRSLAWQHLAAVVALIEWMAGSPLAAAQSGASDAPGNPPQTGEVK